MKTIRKLPLQKLLLNNLKMLLPHAVAEQEALTANKKRPVDDMSSGDGPLIPYPPHKKCASAVLHPVMAGAKVTYTVILGGVI